MSADNGYIIRKHPEGGFAAVMFFASDDGYPLVRPERHLSFPSVAAAIESVEDDWTEYGIRLHSEVRR